MIGPPDVSQFLVAIRLSDNLFDEMNYEQGSTLFGLETLRFLQQGDKLWIGHL